MINIFNELYSRLVDELSSYDTNIKTSSVYTNTPSEYPFVSLEEIENAVDTRGSNCKIENFADIQYEVNIYTKNPQKKAKADAILEVVNQFFEGIGFVRVSKNALQDTNETIYRIIVRYEGVVSTNKVIYRR